MSTREVALELDLPRQLVWDVLNKNNFKPYKIHVSQTLHPGDEERRMQWCNWLLEKINLDGDFLNKIIWTDECKFTNCGMFNRHNEHYWAIENPRQFREARPQIRFGLNVWAGIVGDTIIGPYIFEETLNAARYEQFLRTQLLNYLEDLPLARLRELWWQQDGAPPHNAREVVNILNNYFPNKWIGNNGFVRWPARSPDMSVLDYFLWGVLKGRIYKTRSANIEELRNNIINAFRGIRRRDIARAVSGLRKRAELCLETNGAQFEHLL